MKQKTLLILLVSVIVFLVFTFVICNFIVPGVEKLTHNIRWDKVPVIGLFVLGISKSMGVEASYYDEPITCEDFINKPDDWPEELGYWFSNSLNNYTQTLIYDYMKDNNLGIVPKQYIFETTSDFEEMLEVLEFVPLD